jgi:hypothetical protein
MTKLLAVLARWAEPPAEGLAHLLGVWADSYLELPIRQVAVRLLVRYWGLLPVVQLVPRSAPLQVLWGNFRRHPRAACLQALPRVRT